MSKFCLNFALAGVGLLTITIAVLIIVSTLGD